MHDNLLSFCADVTGKFAFSSNEAGKSPLRAALLGQAAVNGWCFVVFSRVRYLGVTRIICSLFLFTEVGLGHIAL